MSAPVSSDGTIERRRRAVTASLVVSGATTLVTGIAHALGGGAAPAALLLAAALVTTLLVLAPVLGSRPSIARQSIAVVLAQLVQHALYSVPSASAPIAGAHAHHGAATQLDGSAAMLHEHASMPLAHLVAGAVTLALLRLVPRAVDAMIEAMSLRRALAVLRWRAPLVRGRASVIATSPARRRTLDVLHAALVTRGPPLSLA